MKFLRSTASLLLLSVFTSPSLAATDKPGSVQHLAADKPAAPGPVNPPVPAATLESRPDKGTKDAPVDGQDGKPHAGPFVDSQKKKPLVVEDLGGSKGSGSAADKERVLSETFEKPDEEPGVMRDDMREGKLKGPTGTEGGVSAKEKDGKDKKPGQPKEAATLDDIEGKSTEKTETTTTDKKKGAAGLEVGPTADTSM
jgi:hypothetical protein